jgi:hypothetical protein
MQLLSESGNVRLPLPDSGENVWPNSGHFGLIGPDPGRFGQIRPDPAGF